MRGGLGKAKKKEIWVLIRILITYSLQLITEVSNALYCYTSHPPDATGTVGNAVLRERPCFSKGDTSIYFLLTGDNFDTAEAEIVVHTNYTE